MVKLLMKIVGAELVHQTNPDDGIMELTLVSKEIVKRKPPGLMEMAMGGFEDMIAQAQGSIQRKFKVYVPLLDWIKEFQNQPLSDVWFELILDRTASEIGHNKK